LTGEAAPKELSDSTTLAVERTRLAAERTMMAWVRTATSLITFGFSVYKFFDIEHAATEPAPHRLIGPREFAIILILIGLLSLVFSTVQQRQNMQLLRARYHGVQIQYSLAVILAGLISLLGLFCLWVVLYRH
jgi:putative membrane protein